MIQIIKEINVEVTKPNIFQALVAKQYDMNTRFLKVTLMDCGDRIDVPATETTRVVINAERKDGQSKGFDGEINEDGTVTVPLHSWMLELDGTVNCDISVIDTATDDNKKLTTTTFALLVEKAAYGGDGITSDPQYDVLIQLINDCNEVYQNFLEANDRVDSLEADVEGLKQSSVTKDYVDSHLEGVSDLVSDNQDDIRNLGERTAAVETSVETLKRTYVDTQRFEETSQGLKERITYAESDIIRLEEDIEIIREDFATKEYVDDAVASSGGGTGGGVSKEYVDGIAAEAGQSINYIMENYVKNETLQQVITVVDTNYATNNYVNGIANQASQSITYITENYATKQYVEDYINEALGGEY